MVAEAWGNDRAGVRLKGILCFNLEVNEEVALWLSDKFIEILIAPSYSDKAKELLSKKKNLRVLVTPIKPEVTGENNNYGKQACIVHQPDDVESIANSIIEVITNIDTRTKYIALGLDRAKLFSWAKSARQVEQVYKQVGHR